MIWLTYTAAFQAEKITELKERTYVTLKNSTTEITVAEYLQMLEDKRLTQTKYLKDSQKNAAMWAKEVADDPEIKQIRATLQDRSNKPLKSAFISHSSDSKQGIQEKQEKLLLTLIYH